MVQEQPQDIYRRYKEEIEGVVGGETYFECDGTYGKRDYSGDYEDTNVRFYLNRSDNRNRIASWSMTQLPGCSGVAISTRLEISNGFRGRGLNNILIRMRLELAKNADFGAIVATTISDRRAARPENASLRRAGFLEVAAFQNPRTNHEILMWFKDLNDSSSPTPVGGPF